MVIEWASKHLYELDENWKLAIKNEPINKIEPLI
jgi:hypothetical protein